MIGRAGTGGAAREWAGASIAGKGPDDRPAGPAPVLTGARGPLVLAEGAGNLAGQRLDEIAQHRVFAGFQEGLDRHAGHDG